MLFVQEGWVRYLHDDMGRVSLQTPDSHALPAVIRRSKDGSVVASHNERVARGKGKVVGESSGLVDVSYSTICWVGNCLMFEAREKTIPHEVIRKRVRGSGH